jgi:hypothetical protein
MSTSKIEVEHPDSVEMLGPTSSKKCEILAVRVPRALPI